MAAPNPTSPGLYCDPLWITDCLPTTITVGATTYTKLISGSINGVSWVGLNPINQIQMIDGINAIISQYAYGAIGITVFDLRTMCLDSRYVVMGGTGTPNAADQLYVSATGVITYTPTNWV
jgi:hypothetical protein